MKKGWKLTSKKFVQILAANLIVAAFLWFVIEGFSSSLLVTAEFLRAQPVAERRHTVYDEELGWLHIPNYYVQDMYGRGVYLRTNSQSFRSNRDFTTEIPLDKVRIICSGDSFTLGFGVDNDHTWCKLLSTLNEKLETINMGQGGYGTDQAYLWYMRDGIKFEHNIHLFAFISNDFERMRRNTFAGYGKPFLELRGDSLVNANYPVPASAYYVRWFRNIQVLNRLATVRFLKGLSQKLGLPGQSEERMSRNEATAVTARMLENLQKENERKGSVLVLVFLPMREDYIGNNADFWRTTVSTEAQQKGIPFIDLVEELRNVPPLKLPTLFAGHYSNAGNDYIARRLYEKLLEVRKVSAELSQQ